MKRLTVRSIRTHLLLLVALAALPALAILIYNGLEAEAETSRQVNQTATRQAFHLAEMLERTVADTRQLLSVAIQVPQIRQGDVKASTAILSDLLRQDNRYSNLILTSPDGRMQATGLGTFPHTAGDRKYFQEAVRTQRFSAGEYIIARTSRRPSLHFALPIFDGEARLLGVLAAALDLSNLDPIFDRLQLPPGSSYVLLDHQGIVLRMMPGKPQDAGRPYEDRNSFLGAGRPPSGTVVRRDPQGVEQICAYEQLFLQGQKTPYLTVVVNIPRSPALASARGVLWRNVLLLGLAALVASTLALAHGERAITAPIRRLLAMTSVRRSGQPASVARSSERTSSASSTRWTSSRMRTVGSSPSARSSRTKVRTRVSWAVGPVPTSARSEPVTGANVGTSWRPAATR
jgi:hypothetical protein